MSTTKPVYTSKVEELEEETQSDEGQTEVGEQNNYPECQFAFSLYTEPCVADVDMSVNS